MLLEKNEMNLRYALEHVDEAVWFDDGVFIRPIKPQAELVYLYHST